MKITPWHLIAAIFIGGGFGFLLTWHLRPVPDRSEVEASERRVSAAQCTIDSLLAEVAKRDTDDVRQQSLLLDDLNRLDSLHRAYAQLEPRIATADARALRHLCDSLLAGFIVNRTRYRMLLDRGIPLDSGRVGNGD